jgi:class 3 adenylate cyclase
MSDVVFAHDGVIVQFAGDAIEAFWNAPMDQPDHARRACQAALDMSLALGAIRPDFEARGWDHVDLGIGTRRIDSVRTRGARRAGCPRMKRPTKSLRAHTGRGASAQQSMPT